VWKDPLILSQDILRLYKDYELVPATAIHHLLALQYVIVLIHTTQQMYNDALIKQHPFYGVDKP
jgi:hypothetical protein